MDVVRTPTFKTGFAAPDRGNLRYPQLWRGCIGAWCPSIGAFGSVLRDWSVYRKHGALTNMDPATDWVANGGNIALDFDGTNDYVSVSLSIGTAHTISFWLRPENASDFVVIGGDDNGGGLIDYFPYIDGLSASNSIYYRTAASGVSMPVSVVHGSLSGWTHIAITRQNTAVEFYKGGSQIGSTQTLDANNVGTLKYIGNSNGTQLHFDGQLDDIRIYNRPVSKSEIATLARRRGIAFERRLSIVAKAPTGGIVGTAAITEANDTLASVATIALASVLSATEANDTLTSAATIAIVAALAATEAADTLTSASALSIVATSAITEADDSLSSTATIAIAATATITEANDTLASTATITDNERDATLSVTEANDTVSSTATIVLVAVVAVTESDDSLTGVAGVAIVAVSAITEASDTLSSASTIGLAAPIWTIDLSLTGRRTATDMAVTTTASCLAVTAARSTAFSCQYNDAVPPIAAGYGFLVESDGDYLVNSDGDYLIASV